jgi:hypothetical protein
MASWPFGAQLLLGVAPVVVVISLLWWFGRQTFLYEPQGALHEWSPERGTLRDHAFWHTSPKAPVLRAAHVAVACTVAGILCGGALNTAVPHNTAPPWLWLVVVRIGVVLLVCAVVGIAAGADEVPLPLGVRHDQRAGRCAGRDRRRGSAHPHGLRPGQHRPPGVVVRRPAGSPRQHRRLGGVRPGGRPGRDRRPLLAGPEDADRGRRPLGPDRVLAPLRPPDLPAPVRRPRHAGAGQPGELPGQPVRGEPGRPVRPQPGQRGERRGRARAGSRAHHRRRLRPLLPQERRGQEHRGTAAARHLRVAVAVGLRQAVPPIPRIRRTGGRQRGAGRLLAERAPLDRPAG